MLVRVALLAGLLLAPAGPVLAKDDPCALVRALGRDGSKPLAGITSTVRADGLIDVTYRMQKTPIIGADDCDISGPVDIFSLSCEWETGLDLAAATRRRDQLKVALDSCFAGGLEPKEQLYKAAGLEVLAEHNGERSTGNDGGTVTVRLALHRYIDDGATTMYSVDLSIAR